jgi:transposase
MKRILKLNNMKEVLEELSENSLKESNYEALCEKMKINLKHAVKLFSVYGTRNHARKRFDRVRKKQSFYSTIAKKIAPDPETIIVMGDAKFSKTRVGLSACPIAKITERLSKTRRVVMTPETCTTMKCSCCRDNEVNTVSAVSKTKRTSKRTGKDYYPKIHGLRHCKKCAKSWNRDFNAARNIFFMFHSLLTQSIRALYLKRKFTDTCRIVKTYSRCNSSAPSVPSAVHDHLTSQFLVSTN